MLWLVFALLLMMGMVSLFTSYSLIGGMVQIVVICAIAVFGIHRIWRMRAS